MPANGNLSDFLLSLAKALMSISGLAIWVHQANEMAGADPYVVLRVTGGPAPEELLPVREAAIQAMATGKTPGATLTMLEGVYNALYSTDGQGNTRPRNTWIIPGFKKDGSGNAAADTMAWEVRTVAVLQQPGIIGVDRTSLKHLAAFNFQTRYQPRDLLAVTAAAGESVTVGEFTFSGPVDATQLAATLFVVTEDTGSGDVDYPGLSVAQVTPTRVAVTFGTPDVGGLSGWPWRFAGMPGLMTPGNDVFPG